MTELLAFAEKYGPWLVILIYAVYRLVPVAAEKLIPDWIANRRASVKAEREELVKVYERFITMYGEMIQFVSAATQSLNNIDRTIIANTQQLFVVSKMVERGPKCPLPECPYWKEKAQE